MYEEAKFRGAYRAVDAAVESIGYMGIGLADGDLGLARDLNGQANDETQRARRYLLAADESLAAPAPILLFQLDTPDTRELPICCRAPTQSPIASIRRAAAHRRGSIHRPAARREPRYGLGGGHQRDRAACTP